MKRMNLLGQRFGRLTVIGDAGMDATRKNKVWQCQCDCGQTRAVPTAKLTRGHYVSCGCYRRELLEGSRQSHGMSKTRTYKIWKGMHYRCTNPKCAKYHRYCRRGIEVCKRWDKFGNFYDDMGAAPKGMSIDRIDNDGDYEPSNCRWATPRTQARSYSRHISHHGETKTIAAWASEQGVDRRALKARLDRGWSIDRALNQSYRRSSRCT